MACLGYKEEQVAKAALSAHRHKGYEAFSWLLPPSIISFASSAATPTWYFE